MKPGWKGEGGGERFDSPARVGWPDAGLPLRVCPSGRVQSIAPGREDEPRGATAGGRCGVGSTDPGDPAKGFDPERIEYLVKPNGMSGLVDEVDFVYSRAVLEHVNDLPGTFADMARAMRPGSQSIHLADLRSHGLHKANPLDFLEWSPAMWSLMYSEKGVPNRWRVDEYRRILTGLGVRVGSFEPTALATAADIAAVRPRLAAPFQRLSDTDLACLGIWFDFEKPKT